MHRQFIAWGFHGTAALCGPYLEPMMDKREYKTQMTYPIPNTAKINGTCCQPFGRTTVLCTCTVEPIQVSSGNP